MRSGPPAELGMPAKSARHIGRAFHQIIHTGQPQIGAVCLHMFVAVVQQIDAVLSQRVLQRVDVVVILAQVEPIVLEDPGNHLDGSLDCRLHFPAGLGLAPGHTGGA